MKQEKGTPSQKNASPVDNSRKQWGWRSLAECGPAVLTWLSFGMTAASQSYREQTRQSLWKYSAQYKVFRRCWSLRSCIGWLEPNTQVDGRALRSPRWKAPMGVFLLFCRTDQGDKEHERMFCKWNSSRGSPGRNSFYLHGLWDFFFQSLFYLMYFISYLKCFLDCIEKTKMFVAPVSDTVLLTQLMFNTGLLNYRFM